MWAADQEFRKLCSLGSWRALFVLEKWSWARPRSQRWKLPRACSISFSFMTDPIEEREQRSVMEEKMEQMLLQEFFEGAAISSSFCVLWRWIPKRRTQNDKLLQLQNSWNDKRRGHEASLLLTDPSGPQAFGIRKEEDTTDLMSFTYRRFQLCHLLDKEPQRRWQDASVRLGHKIQRTLAPILLWI